MACPCSLDTSTFLFQLLYPIKELPSSHISYFTNYTTKLLNHHHQSSIMKYSLLLIGALVFINQTSALAIRPFSYFTKPQIEVNQHNDDRDNTNITPSDKRNTFHFDDDDLLFSYFLNRTVLDNFHVDDDDADDADTPENSTTATNTTNTILDPRGSGDGRDYSTLGRKGKVPLHELPCCYQKCMIDNCCNAMIGGPGDIRELTTEEFCRTKWFYVGNWMLDHLSFCVKDLCASCRPGCKEDSNKWMKRVCG